MPTPEEILTMAAAENVEIRTRMGRISFRGASDALGLAALENERALVEHLGGSYRSPWIDVEHEWKLRRGVRRGPGSY